MNWCVIKNNQIKSLYLQNTQLHLHNMIETPQQIALQCNIKSLIIVLGTHLQHVLDGFNGKEIYEQEIVKCVEFYIEILKRQC